MRISIEQQHWNSCYLISGAIENPGVIQKILSLLFRAPLNHMPLITDIVWMINYTTDSVKHFTATLVLKFILLVWWRLIEIFLANVFHIPLNVSEALNKTS